MWRGRTPAYIYLSKDGPQPLQAAGCDDMPIWGNKGQTTTLVDGLLQESVRDSGHANLGLSSMVNAAETARQQGVDLYAEQADRICAALEFQAQFLPPNNAPPVKNVVMHAHPTWESLTTITTTASAAICPRWARSCRRFARPDGTMRWRGKP